MNLDNLNWLQTAITIALTLSGSTVITAIINKKSREDRAQERAKSQKEIESISVDAAETAVKTLRSELVATNEEVERRRVVVQGQDERLNRQNRLIAGLYRKIEAQGREIASLRYWVQVASSQLELLGQTMPPVPPFESASVDLSEFETPL